MHRYLMRRCVNFMKHSKFILTIMFSIYFVYVTSVIWNLRIFWLVTAELWNCAILDCWRELSSLPADSSQRKYAFIYFYIFQSLAISTQFWLNSTGCHSMVSRAWNIDGMSQLFPRGRYVVCRGDIRWNGIQRTAFPREKWNRRAFLYFQVCIVSYYLLGKWGNVMLSSV